MRVCTRGVDANSKADATATVKWDAKNLTPDDPSLMAIVKPTYRDGYEV